MAKFNLNNKINFNETTGKNDFQKFEKGIVVKIPIEMISIGENIRDKSTDQNLDELSQSIKDVGILQPIIVYEANDKYIIKEGSRRFKATVKAGLSTCDCIVSDPFKDEKERILIQAIENEQRLEMTPEERETYCMKLIDLGLKQNEIAAMLHKSTAWVTLQIRGNQFKKENPTVSEALDNFEGQVSTDTLYNLSRLSKEDAEKVIEEAKSAGTDAVGLGKIARNKRKQIKQDKQNQNTTGDSYSDSQIDDFLSGFDSNEKNNKDIKFNFTVHHNTKTNELSFDVKKTDNNELMDVIKTAIENFYKR